MYKVIIQGKLEFGVKRTFDQVSKMLDQRLETYYKNDIIMDPETLLTESTLSMDVPRKVAQVYPKTWKNTINLFQFVAQFGVAGSVSAWKLEDGKLLEYVFVEPMSEKAVVILYKKGQELSQESGKEKEAIEALSKAIEKYDKHSQAYEIRAYVNFALKEYDEALRDFSKSIDIYQGNAGALYGRARIYFMREEYKKAIADLELCIKKSIALQPLYWKARRFKSECHMILDESEKALFDLKFFTKKEFKPDNPNHEWMQWAFYNYGILLLENNEFQDSLKAFEKALKISDDFKKVSEAEIYLQRGIAKQKTGGSGFISDWKKAAKSGIPKAKTLLKEFA